VLSANDIEFTQAYKSIQYAQARFHMQSSLQTPTILACIVLNILLLLFEYDYQRNS
jgi:hypothetical protein